MPELVEVINIKDPNSISAVDASSDLLSKSNSNNNLAQVLLKESTSYENDSQAKAQKAREYIQLSNDLKQKAIAVRLKASLIRQGKLSKEEKTQAVKDIISVLPDNLKLLVPLNASPEVLDKIAHELEERAKHFRTKADDLLKDSEESGRLSKQLKRQSGLINRRDLKVSDLRFQFALAHNQGLLLILKKLSIAKLDAEYKEQVAYAHGESP